MPQPPPKRMKGTGRVGFLAHKVEIAAELEAGWPVKAVYQARAEKLGISYPQFVRYVNADIRGRAQRPKAGPPAAVSPAPAASLPPKPVPPAPEGTAAHARHEPAGRSTFRYDGIVRPGDKDRLIGPGPEKDRDPKE